MSEEEIIKQEAQDFRMKSCYKCQFLRHEDVIKYNIIYQDLSQGGNTWTLYNNMRLLGLTDDIWVNECLKFHFRQRKFTRSQTHHVIPKTLIGDSSVKLNLKELIDDGRNGIILPSTSNCEYNFALGTAHGKHYSDYDDYVKKLIALIDDPKFRKSFFFC